MSCNMRVIAFLICVLCGPAAFAQTRIEFQNTLDVPINFILTNPADNSETTIQFGVGAIQPFNIPPGASIFNARIMPLDNTGSGSRFVNRNLIQQAQRANGRPVPLGGIVEPRSVTVCKCRLFRKRCWTETRNVRVATFIDEFNTTGGTDRVTEPLETY
jgi:hypothetical protein